MIVVQAETVGRLLDDISLDILLRGGILRHVAWHSVDGQVLVLDVEIALLQMVEQLFSLVADESVVILVLDMANELIVVEIGTLGHCLDRVDSDSALEGVILHVGEMECRKQEVSRLLHFESVNLDDLN